jgi:hypothetical protein
VVHGQTLSGPGDSGDVIGQLVEDGRTVPRVGESARCQVITGDDLGRVHGRAGDSEQQDGQDHGNGQASHRFSSCEAYPTIGETAHGGCATVQEGFSPREVSLPPMHYIPSPTYLNRARILPVCWAITIDRTAAISSSAMPTYLATPR